MRQPPVLATFLLTRVGLVEEALLGDLYQEWSAGRSTPWFWYQAMAAVAWSAAREIGRRPGRTWAALLVGWAVAGIVFRAGDTIAEAVAGQIWGWHRAEAYITNSWGPFLVGALLVTYGGFGLSAWIVARLHRRYPAMLIAYVASTFVLLLVTGIVMDVLIRRGTPIPMLHPLFYPVSVTLPYQWHSGIVLVPVTMLLCGALALRAPSQERQPGRR
jgi:hypothetical protein